MPQERLGGIFMLEKLNRKRNLPTEVGNGIINGQGLGYVAEMRYGLFPMSYNGCEMIAIYNLLLLEGRQGVALTDICTDMYKTACVFCGLLGSNVYVLDKYFTRCGMPVLKTFSRDRFFDMLNVCKYGIISFWNANDPFKGVHTVCIEKTENGYRIYNRSNRRDTPADFTRVDEVVSHRRFMAGYCLYQPTRTKRM